MLAGRIEISLLNKKGLGSCSITIADPIQLQCKLHHGTYHLFKASQLFLGELVVRPIRVRIMSHICPSTWMSAKVNCVLMKTTNLFFGGNKKTPVTSIDGRTKRTNILTFVRNA